MLSRTIPRLSPRVNGEIHAPDAGLSALFSEPIFGSIAHFLTKLIEHEETRGDELALRRLLLAKEGLQALRRAHGEVER